MPTDEERRRSSTATRTDKERVAYFSSHKCSMTNIPNKYPIRCNRFKRFIVDLVTVNIHDVRAQSMFKSYASLSQERYRQFTQYPIAIHPYSKLRFWAEVFVAISIFMTQLLLPFWMASKKPKLEDKLHIVIASIGLIHIFINIPVNLLTGYIDGKNKQYIVLDKFKILRNYVFTWMLVDLLALACLVSDIVRDDSSECFVLHLLSVFQLLILFRYVQNTCKALKMGEPAQTALELVLFLITYLSSNILFQFTVEYSMEDGTDPQNPRNSSWMTIENLWNETAEIKLLCSLTRAVAMLRKDANIHLLREDGSFEIFFIVAWVVAQIIIVHCSFKYMMALFGMQSAKAKYYMMSQQLQTYMNQRRFPPRIKEKILKFYAIRFQSHFFVESTMMACVSGQLREDIIMRTGRQLVREITFLKQLPRAVLIQICQRFELVIFIEGDVIYKINTDGDRMYFIHKGTVAIYCESGCEIFHLEDGDYFGEVALITKHKYRLNTVVAVTNCELFSLSRENFGIIECYPTAYDELKKAAVRRIQLIKIAEEQYRAQLKDLQ